MNHQLIMQRGTRAVWCAFWRLWTHTHTHTFLKGGTPLSFIPCWLTLCLRNCINTCKLSHAWTAQREHVWFFAVYRVCFGDSLNKKTWVWHERTSPILSGCPLPLWLSCQKTAPEIRHGRHLLCFKAENTGNSVPTATCGCVRVAPMAKAALLTVFWWFITCVYTDTIPVIVFLIPEETQETVMCQPVTFILRHVSLVELHNTLGKAQSTWASRPERLLHHRFAVCALDPGWYSSHLCLTLTCCTNTCTVCLHLVCS